MNTDLLKYLSLLPQFLVLLPAALLCYLPMKNRLKFSRKKTFLMCMGVFVPYTAAAAGICLAAGADTNIILIPSFVLFFIFYRFTVRAIFSCELSVFVGVCTLMSFPAQFAYGFDARLYPDSNVADFSMWGGLFQLGVSCLFAAALSVPCARVYSVLVERLSYPQVWYPFLAIHGIIFVFNMLMIPYSYKTLYTGRAFPSFFAVETVMLLLFIFLHIVFYHIADVVLKHAELSERSRLLEMQAEEYGRLQSYMRQSSMLRHDFRQSVHILSALADEGDLSGLRAHLREYEERWSHRDTPVNFCANAALNALFNYYKEMADAHGIKTEWQLSIPEPLTVSELDLAGLFGNIMENAISGCMTVPEGRRRFALSVEERQGNCLYIVSTNSFDGKTRKNGDRYLSTKHNGTGTGLLSIATVAEKYGGYARISDDGREFFVDVMFKV